MKPVLLQAGHHMRSKTNSPIFGILTQPVPRAWLKDERVNDEGWNTYVESSHVEWLQAGGARVVPIDYRQNDEDLMLLLSSLNGLYIPGDTKDTFDSEDFTYAVRTSLDWVQNHNMQEGNHFPVVGNSYGMLSMLKSQLPDTSFFKPLDLDQVHEALEQNLLQHPQDTFIFDEVEGIHLEALMDHVTFYNAASVGITVGDFDYIKALSVFVPVTSYNNNNEQSRLAEFVSTIEGTV